MEDGRGCLVLMLMFVFGGAFLNAWVVEPLGQLVWGVINNAPAMISSVFMASSYLVGFAALCVLVVFIDRELLGHK